MKNKKAAFFDFAPIYREKIPVNDEIYSKIGTKMGYNGKYCKSKNASSMIFPQKSPAKLEQRE